MVVSPSSVPSNKDCLVQHYIRRPLTIGGYKFDLRIYACLTCIDPLRVYVYKDGLVRFASQPYKASKSSLRSRCVHLTNFSINKHQENVKLSTTEDGKGFKWSLMALKNHLEQNNIAAWDTIWQQIHDIIAKTMIAAEPKISTEVNMYAPSRTTCFEVFGFDILLDRKCNAWLIEVNTCPALSAPTAVDRQVKCPMLQDVFHMIGVTPFDRAQVRKEQKAKLKARLTGLGTQKQQKWKKKDLKDVYQMDWKSMNKDDYPEVLKETLAEYNRRRNWERVFPCVKDPNKYLDLFEKVKYDNLLLCRYYASRMKKQRTTAVTGLPMGFK